MNINLGFMLTDEALAFSKADPHCKGILDIIFYIKIPDTSVKKEAELCAFLSAASIHGVLHEGRGIAFIPTESTRIRLNKPYSLFELTELRDPISLQDFKLRWNKAKKISQEKTIASLIDSIIGDRLSKNTALGHAAAGPEQQRRLTAGSSIFNRPNPPLPPGPDCGPPKPPRVEPQIPPRPSFDGFRPPSCF